MKIFESCFYLLGSSGFGGFIVFGFVFRSFRAGRGGGWWVVCGLGVVVCGFFPINLGIAFG
jgi:hypothetical protein